MKIVVIDYGIGNVRSISNAFQKFGINPILSRDKDTILNADGVILPGVGAFSHGMKKLHQYSLINTLKIYVKSNKPLLGICLGMQMLFDESEEYGVNKGLEIISGRVVKFPIKNNDKLPHVSWNEIKLKNLKWDNTILDSVNLNADMYFVHSFVAIPENDENILSITKYGEVSFCSSVKKGNVYGCQFHPEKSGETGLKIIENFIKIVKGVNYKETQLKKQ